MKYALVNGKKREAKTGLKGKCPSCNSEMIPNCGEIKVYHWAHKGQKNCDPWWENETLWHRVWKDNYPKNYQEVVHLDEDSGEKHIADVKTTDGLVIEFQHSYIKMEESKSREMFYKKMIWVVDGTRLKRDFKRFLNGINDVQSTNKKGVYIMHFPEECFPKTWVNSSVPVIFDFLGIIDKQGFHDTKDILRSMLYVLLPKGKRDSSLLIQIDRTRFIKGTLDGTLFFKEPKKSAPNIQQSVQPRTRRELKYYFDPKKGKMVRKWRF